MFGKDFKVLQIPMDSIYKAISQYEAFYAYEENGMLEYEILDDLFGQPSPANWDDSPYAQLMRAVASDLLEEMIEKGIIELI